MQYHKHLQNIVEDQVLIHTALYPTIQAPNHTGTQPYRHPTIQAPNHTGTQPYRHPTIQTPNHTGTQPYRHPTIQAPNHTDTQPYRHPTIQAPNHTDTQPYRQFRQFHSRAQYSGHTYTLNVLFVVFFIPLCLSAEFGCNALFESPLPGSH